MNLEPISVQHKCKSHPGVNARLRLKKKYAALQFVSVSRSPAELGEICTAPPPAAIVEAPPVVPVRKALAARLFEADRRLAEQTKELDFIRKRLHSAEAQLEAQAPQIHSLKNRVELYRRRLLEQIALASLSAPVIPPGSLVSSPEPTQSSTLQQHGSHCSS